MNMNDEVICGYLVTAEKKRSNAVYIDLINKFDALCERASQLFGKDPSEFSLDTKFEDLNIKSVQVSQITTYLEDELDVEVPYMKFRRCATFGEAVDFVADLLDE